MASATPGIFPLNERDDHNLRYCTQYVEADAKPYRAARGALVLAEAADTMANTRWIEFPKEIYVRVSYPHIIALIFIDCSEKVRPRDSV